MTACYVLLESKKANRKGKHAFVWIYKCCLNVSAELVSLYTVGSSRYHATTEMLNTALTSPPHSLQSKGRRQVILWMDDGIKIHLCKAINVSISEGRNHIFQIDSTNLCTRGRQRNQFKSVFPIADSFWTFDNLSRSSELGHGNILCTIQSRYWSLLLFFFFLSLMQNFSLWHSMRHQFVRETHLSIRTAHFHMHEFFFISELKQFNTIQPDKLTYCIGVSSSHNAVWAALKLHKLFVNSKKFFHLKTPID